MNGSWGVLLAQLCKCLLHFTDCGISDIVSFAMFGRWVKKSVVEQAIIEEVILLLIFLHVLDALLGPARASCCPVHLTALYFYCWLRYMQSHFCPVLRNLLVRLLVSNCRLHLSLNGLLSPDSNEGLDTFIFSKKCSPLFFFLKRLYSASPPEQHSLRN